MHMADDATCPGCREKVNGAQGIGHPEARPVAGDISVCAHCGCLLLYVDEAGHVQHLPASEFKALPLNERKQLASIQSKVLGALKGGRL